MKKVSLLLLAVIVIFAFILRFYKLTGNPPGIYSDEVAMGYNAYSILKTGKDEWGAKLPLLFRSFDDYKAPLYIYTVALFEKFLGPTDLAIRLPSVLAGTISVVVMFFLTLELLHNLKIALVSAGLLAVSSWHLQFSRIGFEGSLALLLVLLGLYFFLLGIRRSVWFITASLFFFALSAMAYHAEKIFTPLFLGCLFLVFLPTFRKNFPPKAIIAVLIGILFFLPYLPTYFSSAGRARFTQESIFGQKEPALALFTQNYLSSFSLDYLFFRGDQNGRHSVKKLGELFNWQLPFVLAGLYYLVKKKSRSSAIIFAWLLLAALPVALVRPAPHAYRNFVVVPAWEILCALGLWQVWTLISPKKFKALLFSVITLVAIYTFAVYINHYYSHAFLTYAADWMDGSREAAQYLTLVSKNYDRILISDQSIFPVYLLYYSQYDPARLQASGHNLSKFGKFQYFSDLKITKGNMQEKDLVLVPVWAISADDKAVVKEIKMVNGDPVFRAYEL